MPQYVRYFGPSQKRDRRLASQICKPLTARRADVQGLPTQLPKMNLSTSTDYNSRCSFLAKKRREKMVGRESNRATMKAVPMTNCVPGRATVVSCVSHNNQSGNVGQKYSLPSRWLASHIALCFMVCPCRIFPNNPTACFVPL